MSFKKTLKNKKAQAIVEYIALFLVLAAGVIAVFGGFSPETIKDKLGFETVGPKLGAVDRAIEVIKRQ